MRLRTAGTLTKAQRCTSGPLTRIEAILRKFQMQRSSTRVRSRIVVYRRFVARIALRATDPVGVQAVIPGLVVRQSLITG